MRYFVDTNIFLRTFIKEDEAQFENCINFLQQVKEGKIEAFTNTAVLAEIVWTLTSYYRFTKIQVVKALRGIINLHGLDIVDRYNQLEALDLYEKFTVKFIDTLIASDKEILNKEAIVITYDKDFAKLPLLHKEPGEI